MKYYLCQHENKISEHLSEHALDLAFEKTKREKAYKVIIPNLEIGLKIYSNEKYYGEVVDITNSLIRIRRPKDIEPLDCMVMDKDRFETLYINKTFHIDIM